MLSRVNERVAGGLFIFLSLFFHNNLTGQLKSTQANWVDSTLAHMTLEEKVGQLIVADFVAVYSHEESENFARIRRQIERFHVGGIILAGGAVTDIALLLNELQRLSKVPMIVSADLESGLGFWHPWRFVKGRAPDLPHFISGGGTAFPGNMAIAATGNEQYAYEVGRITGEEARAVGIHWTLAPVVDVNNNPKNPIVNVRSFGEDPERVAKFSAAFIRGCQDVREMATAKHFPGHGDTQQDSHMGLPILKFDMDRLSSVELVPFKAAIGAGVRSIMTAHLALPKLDSTRYPATLSKPILTDLLRRKLHFNGVIVTDGLTMQGITDRYSPAEAAILAIQAGADALLVPPDIEAMHKGVLDAVKKGNLSESRLDESVRRILSAKSWLGLDKNRYVDLSSITATVASPASEEISKRIARDAVTLLRNKANTLPISRRRTTKVAVVVLSDGSSREYGRDFVEGLRQLYASVDVAHVNRASSSASVEDAVKLSRRGDLVILPAYVSLGAWKGQLGLPKPVKGFLLKISSVKKPVIAISFGDPYIVSEFSTPSAVLCAYSSLRTIEMAVVAALRGEVDIRGKLPVSIPPQFKRGDGIELRGSNFKSN
jgi:beta-N-acetylhexosaminidase